MSTLESRPKGEPRKYKDEMWLQRKILALLDQKGPQTVTEISQALQWPCDEIMMYVMAMRRYDLVEEVPKKRREKYFRYAKKEAS